jgi:hydrogenase maturation protease
MAAPSVLIVGIGNDLLGDDAAGLVAGGTLEREGFPVHLTTRSGLTLLDAVVGVRRVLLIDSLVSGRPAGTLSEFALEPARPRSPSTHYLGYAEALAVARALGLDVPDEIRVLAVERAADVRFGDGLSDAVRAVLPELTDRARTVVRGWLQDAV